MASLVKKTLPNGLPRKGSDSRSAKCGPWEVARTDQVAPKKASREQPGAAGGRLDAAGVWGSEGSARVREVRGLPVGRGDDTVGNPHGAQISQFELFKLKLFNASFSS